MKFGGSIFIKLNPGDLEDLGLKLNDWVNIDDIVKIKKKGKRK